MGKAVKSPIGTLTAGTGFVRAVTLLVSSKFICSFQDVIIKLLSGTFPVHQLVLVRGVAGLPLLLLFIHYDGGLKTLADAVLIMAAGTFVVQREHSVQDKPFSRRGTFRYRWAIWDDLPNTKRPAQYQWIRSNQTCCFHPALKTAMLYPV